MDPLLGVRAAARRLSTGLMAHLVRQGSGGRLVGAAGEMVGEAGGRRVVVLADPACHDAVRGWLHEFSRDHVTLLEVGRALEPEPDQEHLIRIGVEDLDDVVAHLTRLNAQDTIVVVLGPAVLVSVAGDHGDLFKQLFLHLRTGGAYVVDRTAGRTATGTWSHARTEDRLLRLLAVRGDPGLEAGLGRSALLIAHQVDRTLVTDDLVAATKLGCNPLKLGEGRVTDLVEAREPGLEVSVLDSRPAGRLGPAARVRSYGAVPSDPWPGALEYPEMTSRHYHGDLVSLGSMRLYAGNTILPESFRWPRASNPNHPRIESVTPSFARLDRRGPPDVLDGDFYLLDCVFPGYFGHLTTEVLCRLWGWERAKRETPGLRALFHVRPEGRGDGSLERRLFTAYGIPTSDLTASDRPVRLRSVVGASPMWHNHDPYYAHPDIRETWDRVTTGLLAGAEPAGLDRIFVSRGAALGQRRGCRNQDEVESFFAARGYHVLYPEDLPLAEQAAIFAGARVVAGFAGSAMSNLMHCRRLEALVVVSHRAYVARNEHLFAAVLGVPLHYFWQSPDVPRARPVGRDKASERSSFAFDFAAQADDLHRVLAEL